MDRDFYLTRKVDLPAETRWYQFTLRRILGATGWTAVWCCSLALRGNLPANGPFHVQVVFSLLGVFWLAPFVAVGTLIGHPYRALAIGVLLSPLGCLLLFYAGFLGTFRVATAMN